MSVVADDARVEPKATNAATGPGLEGTGPVEGLSLLVLLDHLATRTARIESKLAENAARRSTWLEFAKAIVGWPAFGVLFLILFYGPLHSAINAIPGKVEKAEQIDMFGVSLKTTFRAEAERIGALNLSDTLPALSPSAIELLLRASEGPETTMVSYSLEHDIISRVWLPSPQLLDTLEELEAKDLVTTISRPSGTSADAAREGGIDNLRAGIDQFKRRHPGRERSEPERMRIQWDLDKPSHFDPPYFAWRLTELGRKGVDVILSAVSSQLVSAKTP